MQGRAAEEVTTRTVNPDGPAATDMDELRKNLDFMMAHYEGELKKPIRNLVSGRLPRTLLIQVAPLTCIVTPHCHAPARQDSH